MENEINYVKCNLHLDTPATTNCPYCGKPICMECVENFAILDNGERVGVCHNCYQTILKNNVMRLKKERNLLIANLIISLVAIIAMVIYMVITYVPDGTIWDTVLDYVINIALAGSAFTFAVSFIDRVIKLFSKGMGIFGIIIGIILSLIIEVVLSIFRTIVKFVTAPKKIKQYNESIDSDTLSFALADEYLGNYNK